MERFLATYKGDFVRDEQGNPISSDDKIAWSNARLLGVTATDINKIVSPTGKLSSQREKLLKIKKGELENSGFNVTTVSMTHGNEREPIILDWASGNFDVIANNYLFQGLKPQYLATPDGLGEGFVVEVKTSVKPLNDVLGYYSNQLQWQMFVMGVDKVLFIVEQHKDFSSYSLEYKWVEKDETRINLIVRNVDLFIEELVK